MVIVEASWIVPLQVLIGSVLPVLVGLVTTKVTHSGWKGTLLLVLSFATSILTQGLGSAVDGSPFDIVTALLFGFGTFILGVAVHTGLLKPAGVSAWLVDKAVTPGAHVAVEETETTEDWQPSTRPAVNPEKLEN